jgi:hypothetical protein
MILKSFTLHILPGLAFDVILGFPCIRKYNLTVNYYYFSARAICRCRVALSVASVCQRSASRSAHCWMGETQPEVLLAVPCVGALNLLREPCRVPGGPEVKARRSDQPGGYASAPRGLISDRTTSDLASERLPRTTGATECASRRDNPSGLALDLSGTTGSTECGLHVMEKQARDRQFEYLMRSKECLRTRVATSSGLIPLEGVTPKKCQT